MKGEIAGVVKSELSAEIGADIMLRIYNGVTCVDTGNSIGINNRYAVGQVYAYAYGRLEAFGVNIAEAGIAAALQFRGPNPDYFQGTVGITVSALGVVDFSGSLSLTLGNDCRLVNDNPNVALGMDIITAMNPSDGDGDIETNFQPEAYFAIPLDRNIKITDLNGTEFTYKISLEETILTDSDGNPISHRVAYFNRKSALRLIPTNVLPANDSCLLYTSPSPRDATLSRMPSSA